MLVPCAIAKLGESDDPFVKDLSKLLGSFQALYNQVFPVGTGAGVVLRLREPELSVVSGLIMLPAVFGS